MNIHRELIAERRTYTASRVTHSHPYAQLIIPLQGEMAIEAGAENHVLGDELLFYVPPKCDHSFHSNVRNEFLVLDIPDVMIPSSRLDHKGTTYALNNKWKGIRYLILNELHQESASPSALKELFPYISHNLISQRQPRSIQYIHEHYHENISVQQLAELEHYNRSYYSDWFVRETGSTPSSYLQEVRLNKAKQLLCETNYSILQIAIQVGLEHQSSLTRLFQQFEQITPSQYRKQHTTSGTV
ncbi:DNA-binding protein [Bacillus sp. FJAT-27264]|uniref:helix-turn-helix transcriptional regulator n=1 Tax=Paenibacillus sp. (strain DSM 101736 / FJAT-27264) TaxID=1850362 RepID=UPI000807FA43|nr:AraC family transcriptional regulator [Bacillus sp. FJAT-27264]OBZ14026.1 DNA-binding protein [Bacillus sp. FJAT-27264]